MRAGAFVALVLVAAACNGEATKPPSSHSSPVAVSTMHPPTQPIALSGVWGHPCQCGPIEFQRGTYLVSWAVYNPEVSPAPELSLGVKDANRTTWIHKWSQTSTGEDLFASTGGRFDIIIEIFPNTYTPTTWTVTFTRLTQ